MAKRKITLSNVKALKSRETIWDTELKGFGCRCQKEGKIFILKYSIHGRQRFYTIGEWSGALTPDQARQEAEIIRGQIRKGIDPMAEKCREKAIPLVKDAFIKYLEDVQAKRSPRTYESYRWLYDKFVDKKLGGYRVDAVTRADVARLHSEHKATPCQANRLLAVLSAFFSWCEKYGHRIDGQNPCRHIEKFKETARERFLSEEELYNLGIALKKYEEKYCKLNTTKKSRVAEDEKENIATPYITAAIRLLILTGARRNEILTLKWEDINFKYRLIRLQESKTGQKTIYLSAPALQLLSEIPRIDGNPYVICGLKAGTHLINIKSAWGKIRRDAGLEGVRLHDLRHNYASTAVTSGHHLKIIGSLLGHKETKTTERYAHLANDPLQTANEAISKRIMDSMTIKPSKRNVVVL